jgi:DNA-binding response OmpR family regulator
MTADTRFVVIDANRNFHAVMRGILRAMGYRRVDAFVAGIEALDQLASAHTDFAFVDVTLADGDGLDLIRQMRHEPLFNPAMPIVLLASQTSRRNIVEAIEAGADYVLAKPISPKVLAQRIPALMAQTRDYVRLASGYFGPDPDRAFVKSPHKVVAARPPAKSTNAPIAAEATATEPPTSYLGAAHSASLLSSDYTFLD